MSVKAKLKQAIQSGDLKTVQEIFAKGDVKVNENLTETYTGITLLAVMYSSERDSMGYRAIHWAARADQIEILRFLFGIEANVDEVNFIGNTALHVALYAGCSNAARVLVEEGHADVNVLNKGSDAIKVKGKLTPLHYALVYWKKETKEDVFYLLSKHANAKTKSFDGNTAFHLCMHTNDTDTFAALVKACAPNETDDEDGFTVSEPELMLDAVNDEGLTCFDLGLMNDEVTPSFLDFVLKQGQFVPNIKALEFLVANADAETVNIRARKVLLMLLHNIPLPSTTTLGLLDLMLKQKNSVMINMLMGILVAAATSNSEVLRAQIGLAVEAKAPVVSVNTVASTSDHRLVPTLFSDGAGTTTAISMPSTAAALPPAPPPLPVGQPQRVKSTLPVLSIPANPTSLLKPTMLTVHVEPQPTGAAKALLAPQANLTIADMLRNNARFAKVADANRPKREVVAAPGDCAAEDEWGTPAPSGSAHKK